MQRGGEKMERRMRERGGRKEARKSVFIFLITYRPYGIAGLLFCSCTVMNQCTCVEIKQGHMLVSHNK